MNGIILSINNAFMDFVGNTTMLAGLGTVQENLINNWIKPVFLIAIAVFALKFIKDRQFRQLFVFAIFAAIIGVFIFFGDSLFGKSGAFSGLANKTANEIANTILWNTKLSLQSISTKIPFLH